MLSLIFTGLVQVLDKGKTFVVSTPAPFNLEVFLISTLSKLFSIIELASTFATPILLFMIYKELKKMNMKK